MDFFAKSLLKWFEQYGRRDLPWQQHDKKKNKAYRVWLSEIMLQQTQVKTVIAYFNRFTSHFPTVFDLANANIDEVLSLWTGLGYYARARNLHKTAQIIANEHAGIFPQTIEQLVTLPGIGHSTAAAIASLAFDKPATILDGNVKRVLARFHAIPGWPGKKEFENKLWDLAKQHTPSNNNAAYTQAIMDIGATICTPTQPNCKQCPFKTKCLAHKSGQETAYPEKKPKKQLPTKQVQFIMIENEHKEILLIKRPPSGIWGGLWSFPECELDIDLKHWCLNNLGFSVKHIEPLPTIKHSFSHYHLEIFPKRMQINKIDNSFRETLSYKWHSPHLYSKLGLATPVKHLLIKLKAAD